MGKTMTTEVAQDRFMALFVPHRKIVFKVAGMYCWHPEDRRDLAQEITVQLWRSFPAYDPQRSFSTWMYRIALNVAISFARKAGVRAKYAVSLDEGVGDPIDPRPAADEGDERVLALHRFIAGLDTLNRALLLLYLEEHSYRDISDVLGISETNVATKINRLKQRIRKEM